MANPGNTRVRVVVKLTERAMRDTVDHALTELKRVVPNADFRPYFAGESKPRAATKPPFNRYVTFEAGDRQSAAGLARTLQAHDFVDEAYVEGGPTPPPVLPADDPRSSNQGYLDPAPNGIDARWAWQVADGSGVGFVDCEQGWTLDHEDLVAAGITLISGVNKNYPGHGTAVLGEVVGVDNTRGGIGIAPRANARVVSQWRTNTDYNTAAAILSAGEAMSAGDVLLLEAQTIFLDQVNLPVEVETAVYDAIRSLTDAGIIVVEAAGNGGHDLDDFATTAGQVLNRNSPDFRDSGAIMVAAASSRAPHYRLDFSCYGSRIDCYGWGENIDTTGDGLWSEGTTTYTTEFGGTSGASPMVAGSALLLQSWRKAQGQLYSPAEMRTLLTSNLNTPADSPARDRIGVMPNLRAVFEAEGARPFPRLNLDNYLAYVYILFGIINDAPGYIWVPGKGPVPVDPGWGPRVRGIPEAQRDLIASLAAHEITRTITDKATRKRLNDAAIEGMKNAVARIARI